MAKEHLDKAKKVKDDEFYTLAEDVENIFNLINDKKFFNYILPFNDNNSEFKKYCEKNNLSYFTGDVDYKFFDYNIPNALVVSNPPFSKLREIINFYMFHNIKFILVAPLSGLTYSNIFNFWKEWKINPIAMNLIKFKRPDGSLKRVQCYLLTNLELYNFIDEKTGNIRDDIHWFPKRLEKTEYHIINDNEVYVDKMGSDFKNLFYKNNGYKKIYFPITAILTLTINANRDNCFINHGLPLENGKRTFKKIEMRKYEE